MRIRILTIGMFVLCLSVFFFSAVSSEATTDDQLVINALLDVQNMETAVNTKRLDVNDKWSLVDLVSPKWDAVVDANRYNSTTDYVINLMGSGFWATAAMLLGQPEAVLKSYNARVSLMDLYSSMLNDVKSEISWFYEVTVKLYNSAHTHAQKTVNTHHTNYHTSSSETSHTVPSWSKKTCRDGLPSFLCRGNHFVSGTCDVSYDTPSDAYYTHQLRCGSESASVPAGDGIVYYSCDEVGYALHTDRICVKTYTNSRGVSSPCGVSYRNCMGHKRDHDESDIWPAKTLHSDSVSTENPVVSPPPTPTPTPPPSPTYHACGEHETSVSGDHSLQASCTSTDSNGNTCTVTSFYACDSHTHAYPAPPPPPPEPTLVACGGAEWTNCPGAESTWQHRVQDCSQCDDGYWTCSSWAYQHTSGLKTCQRCEATFYECQNGPCPSGYDHHWAR